MTEILILDIENSFNAILTAFIPLIIPIIVIYLFFHFTRDILFNR